MHQNASGRYALLEPEKRYGSSKLNHQVRNLAYDTGLMGFGTALDGRSVDNVSTNVYAKFRCAPLRIKKTLGIFGR